MMAIPIPIPDTEILASEFGVPVAQLVNQLITPQWRTMPYTAGWGAASGFGILQCAQVGAFIFLAGSAQNNTAASVTGAFVASWPGGLTLPAGISQRMFTIPGSLSASSGISFRSIVNTTGLNIGYNPGVAVGGWGMWDGCFFEGTLG